MLDDSVAADDVVVINGNEVVVCGPFVVDSFESVLCSIATVVDASVVVDVVVDVEDNFVMSNAFGLSSVIRISSGFVVSLILMTDFDGSISCFACAVVLAVVNGVSPRSFIFESSEKVHEKPENKTIDINY